jgi:integrase
MNRQGSLPVVAQSNHCSVGRRTGLEVELAFLRRKFHATRHTAASLMLAEGMPMIVQEGHGHSLLGTTADICGHLFPEAFDEAAEAMERVLTGLPKVR